MQASALTCIPRVSCLQLPVAGGLYPIAYRSSVSISSLAYEDGKRQARTQLTVALLAE
jgi:hypothetical protein